MADIDAAWEEAEASCSTDFDTFNTLELQHLAIRDENGDERPVRLVEDVMARLLGIEAGARFNPGEVAEFRPAAFTSPFAELAQGQVPQAQITIDNVAREITPYLNAAVAYNADLKAIYRQYRSDEPDEPIYGPVEFLISSARLVGASVTGTARLSDLSDRKFPREVYTRKRFPGLAR
ncbi:DUF1833 family protein [Ancylobacter moscoviensis]